MLKKVLKTWPSFAHHYFPLLLLTHVRHNEAGMEPRLINHPYRCFYDVFAFMHEGQRKKGINQWDRYYTRLGLNVGVCVLDSFMFLPALLCHYSIKWAQMFHSLCETAVQFNIWTLRSG